MFTLKPWAGKQLCNVPGDNRALMTYAEFQEARAAYIARRAQELKGTTEEGYLVAEWVPS